MTEYKYKYLKSDHLQKPQYCTRCGSIVVDKPAHEEFHKGLSKLWNAFQAFLKELDG